MELFKQFTDRAVPTIDCGRPRASAERSGDSVVVSPRPAATSGTTRTSEPISSAVNQSEESQP